MLFEYLAKIPDNQCAQGQRYKLHEIVVVSLLALLCGATSYRDITRFIKGRLKLLKALLRLNWKGVPSKSNLRDILIGINKLALEKVFRDYSSGLSQIDKMNYKNLPGLAMDGKALKGSVNHTKGNSMLHLLSVFCMNHELILGHVEIPEKTNKIPTAQALMTELGLPAGCVYTLDALHCQKTFATVKQAKGELITQVKENQGELYREVQEACRNLQPLSVFIAPIEKARNRMEEREAAVFNVNDYLIKS